MNKNDIHFMIAAVLTVLAQIVICNYMFLGPMATVTVLPVLVLFMPLKRPAWSVMTEAFCIGIVIDLFSDGVLGLNAAALVPVALLQKPFIRLFVGEDTVVRRDPVSINKTGWMRAIAMSTLATLLFLVVYVFLDSAGTRSFGFNCARTGISLAASLVFELIAVHVFSNLNKRELP